MVSNFLKNSRYFLLYSTYLIFFLTCPYPHTSYIKDGSLYYKFSNIDDLFSLVIKLNIMILIFLLLNYISFIILGILGGSFILMEYGSSSGSQGQGSNNFTGGGPGGNNGNGPNPGGNNLYGPADGGNNRNRDYNHWGTILNPIDNNPPKTDTDMLAN